MHPINEFGSEAQKEKYLPRLGESFITIVGCPRSNECTTAKGELIGCFVSNAPAILPSHGYGSEGLNT